MRIGPYVTETELGAGGMGRVFRARDDRGSVVALKLLHDHLLDEAGAVERFRREAEIGRRVEHPNVVRTLAVGEVRADGRTHHYLAMEYVEGRTLRRLLEELGRVPEQLCRHIGLAVARGLAAIHSAGAVHRDLKPENVLLTPAHEVKIMDLGVARLQEAAMRLSRTGAFTGSVLYAAPEQFEGRPVDARADHYALGLILYELVSGEHPSAAEDFAAVAHRRLHERPAPLAARISGISPFFDALVTTLLARRPADRPRDPCAVLAEGERSVWWRERRTARPAGRRGRLRVDRDTALCGREPELRQLDEAWRSAVAGDARLLLVEGEAGIGKTRLIDEFAARLEAAGDPFHLLAGSYPAGGAATGAGALSTAFREHFGERGSRPWLDEAPRLAPAFDALLRGEPPPAGEPALRRDSLLAAFVHVTRALAGERPVLLFLDDLHQAPEGARAIVAGLAHAVPGHRVLLVAAARPGLPAAWLAPLATLPHFGRLVLGRLDESTVERLLAGTLGDEEVARDLAARVAERSDGNPFFVREIVRSLRDAGGDPRAAWERLRVPSTVLGLIEARLDELGAEERALLDVAACAGFTFDPVLVAEASGEPIVPALTRLARIERGPGLVRATGRRYRFDHHQVQEVLHAALPPALREALHAALAEQLLRETPEGATGARAVRLCEHLLQAGRPADALRDLDAALDHLEGGHLHDRAVALARRMLDAGDAVPARRRVELLLRAAACSEHLGRVEEEREALADALAEADAIPDPGLAARACRGLGWNAIRTRRLEEAAPLLARALETARATGDDELEALVTASLGNLAFSRDRYEEARAFAERHRSLARARGDRRGEARAAGNLGNALRALHRHEEARACYEESLARFREIGDARGEAMSIGNLGNEEEFLGRHDRARELYERHLELSRAIGYRRGETIATANLGLVDTARGRLDEARARLERGWVLAREVGDRVGAWAAIANLGPLLAALGREEEARRMLTHALAECDAAGERRIAGFLCGALAALALDTGRHEEAEPLVARALELQRATGDRAAEAQTLVERARLRGARGDREAARADCEAALRLGDEVGAVAPPVRAAVLRAALDPSTVAEAAARLRDVEERLKHGLRIELHFRLHQAGAGPGHLEAARTLMGQLLGQLPEADRAAAARVPLHRAVLAAAGPAAPA